MKLWIAILALGAAFLVGGGFALADGMSSSTPTVELASSSTGLDVSGPCDEAENANDPRCAGQTGAVAPTGTTTVDAGTTTLDSGVDISGPCDELEHANDPRCTGQAGQDDDRSNRGPGSGGDDDNSNSGPGGGGDDDDDNSNSGPGGGGDDRDGDDDNSGHGGGDDD